MVVGRGVRRARHGDPAERAGARAWRVRSPRSSPSASDRDWRSLAAPLLSPIGFDRLPGVARHPRRRARRVVPRPERGVERGRQLRVDRHHAARSRRSSTRSTLADQHHHRRVGGHDGRCCCACCGRPAARGRSSAYIAGVLVLMLLPKTVTARPRFLYTAFPLLIPAAVYFHRRAREAWPYVDGACGAGIVGADRPVRRVRRDPVTAAQRRSGEPSSGAGCGRPAWASPCSPCWPTSRRWPRRRGRCRPTPSCTCTSTRRG